VAHDGNLTRTAARLNISQSALSVQIGKLEQRLGQALFDRRGRGLLLTEAGRITLDHADAIFATGDDLLGTLNRTGAARQAVRIGALATLSRNFQMRFLEPLAGRSDIELILHSGSTAALLGGLQSLNLDIILTNEAPVIDALTPFIAHELSQQPVSLIGVPHLAGLALALHDRLARFPLILPVAGSGIRTGFDALVARLGIRPHIAAEVDDMAMMRLLVRAGFALAVLPPIVVSDELAAGSLVEVAALPTIVETFYAVTIKRRFPNAIAHSLIAAAAARVDAP
jgi:LysR family transcriptional regulator, transcriptional activator of nhaA